MSSEREMPQATEAEQSVLGALLVYPDALLKVADFLTEDDFYGRDHRAIYGAILDLAGKSKPFDAVTLGEWFEANGREGELARGYLVELSGMGWSAANVTAYAEIVCERSRMRRIIEAGQKLVNDGFRPEGRNSGDVIAETQQALSQLQPATRHTGPMIAKATMAGWFARLSERCDVEGSMTGLETPWHGLNTATFGLQDSELIVLAARPSIGKSVLGCNLSSFAALRGHRVALFSLEMATDPIHSRNVAAVAGVPYTFLRAPKTEGDYWPKINAAVSALSKAPLFIDESPGLTLHQIRARAMRLHMQAPLRLVVVDHMHEMKIAGKDPVREYGDIARGFKALAKELRCPVVVLAQLNRALTTRTDKRPTMADLRASGEIEQSADVILLLHREDYYDKDTHLQGVVELAIGKGRDIEVGKPIYLKNRYDEMRADDWRGDLPEPKQAEPRSRGGLRSIGGRDRAAGNDR